MKNYSDDTVSKPQIEQMMKDHMKKVIIVSFIVSLVVSGLMFISLG